jgi:hypothetical protein
MAPEEGANPKVRYFAVVYRSVKAMHGRGPTMYPCNDPQSDMDDQA